MAASEIIERLKSTQSAEDIESLTQQLLPLQASFPLPLQLQIITTYLDKILPVYNSLKTTTKLKIRKLFISCAAISQLLNQYKLSGKNEVYFQFTRDLILDPSLLGSTLESCSGNRAELKQTRALFFGSKIFNTFEGKITMDDYIKIVSRQLLHVCMGMNDPPVDYFLALLSLHPIEAKIILFDEFLHAERLKYLSSALHRMSHLQKRQMFHYLIPYLANHTGTNNLSTVASILSQLDMTGVEKHIITTLSEVDNCELQQCFVKVIGQHLQQTQYLLSVWGDGVYIADAASEKQETMTRLILIELLYLEKDQLKQLSSETVFLSAITSRISSNDTRLRNLGMMVAKKLTCGEVSIDMEDEIQVEKPNILISNNIDFADLHLSSMHNLSVSHMKITQVDSDDENDEYSSDDHEESEQDPVFLKDLIQRFTDNSTRSVIRLLQVTVKLVRQKATFGSELQFYSPELIAILLGLLNKYDEDNFEELKLNAIVAVIVSSPQIIAKVFELFFTGDYSLQQRMITLSAIGLSARELRGFDDEDIQKPQFSFPTSHIPQREQRREQIERSKRIVEIESDDEMVGTVLRKSSKLTKPKVQTNKNLFAKHATKFFYPLANGWSAGIDVGGYNELFLKHYLSTLHIVLQASYPCHSYEEMVDAYTQIRDSVPNITL